MLTKITSKGRFFILGTGLFVIAAYLSVALALNNSLTFAGVTDSENSKPVEATSDPLAAGTETGTPSSEAPRNRSEEHSTSSDRRSGQETQHRNRLAHIPAATEKPDVNDAKVETASSGETISFKVSVDSNPLAPRIDPDTPGIARTALTADFESLMESGVDVSSAVRHIDERVADGKYGQNVIRK